MHTDVKSVCNLGQINQKGGGDNPELAKFKSRELIEELRFRGYCGTLTITKEIKL